MLGDIENFNIQSQLLQFSCLTPDPGSSPTQYLRYNVVSIYVKEKENAGRFCIVLYKIS